MEMVTERVPVLVGINPPSRGWGDRERTMVARFSSRYNAWEYATQSRLAHPVKNCPHTPHLAKRVFSLKSLLYQYSWCQVVVVSLSSYVHSLPKDPLRINRT